MLLRPRQKEFVQRSIAALKQHGNTLGVAPTGSGKTIMLSGVVGEMLTGSDAKACILAHRDELTQQNSVKFSRVNPDIRTSIVNAEEKSWRGRATFAMVQTLARDTNLDDMPTLDLLVVDEAHHITAGSYTRIIDKAVSRNPKLNIYGVTATPNRGDKKLLRAVFSNVADQIRIGELIASGHLVPPVTYVIDVGTQDKLKNVRRVADDFDMGQVESVMNTMPVNSAVIHHWKHYAGDRKTVIFCSTLRHAEDVTNAFRAAGISTSLVHGELSTAERKQALADYETGSAQVIVNVAVLTEGWDYQPTSCVVLLRPSSHKSTMIQMIGRGLRTVDPAEFPGVIKTDCIVLDFGISTSIHRSLEEDIKLEAREWSGDKPTINCPGCNGIIPARARECPLCGAEITPPAKSEKEATELTDFVMREIDLLQRSSFQWCDLFGDDAALVAGGFTAWAGVFFLSGKWHAVGGGRGLTTRLLSLGERMICLAAADDWLNTYESEDTAHKTKRWLTLPATDKQLSLLPSEYHTDFGLNRYQASALLTFQFNRKMIRELVFDAALGKEVA